jgi:hypothetical protein
MAPYRNQPIEQLVASWRSPHDGFYFPDVQLRVGPQRFEASFPGLSAPGFWPAVLLMSMLVCVIASPLVLLWWMWERMKRVVVVVTDRSAWVEHRALGYTYGVRALGLRPRVENCGYDWEEIAMVPADAALADALPDGRVVCAEWSWTGAKTERDREADYLIAFMREQIERLHGA